MKPDKMAYIEVPYNLKSLEQNRKNMLQRNACEICGKRLTIKPDTKYLMVTTLQLRKADGTEYDAECAVDPTLGIGVSSPIGTDCLKNNPALAGFVTTRKA